MAVAQMIRCVEYVWTNKLWAMVNAGAALGAGLMGIVLLTWFVYRAAPSNLELVDIGVRSRANGAAFSVNLHYHWSSAALLCERQASQRLYPLTESGYDRRHPVLLGMFMDGPAFPDNTEELWIDVMVPIGTPDGDWMFISKVTYACPPFRLVPWSTSTSARITLPKSVPILLHQGDP